MNKKDLSIGGIIFCVLSSIVIVYFCLTFEKVERKINECYEVYLGSENIGLVKSDKELYDLIDLEQQDLKDKYNVDKVYSPSGLKLQKISTYKNNISTAREIYDEIKDLDPFTIEGYEITIKYSNGEKTVLKVLDKEFLEKAVRNTVLAFVDESAYDNYLSGKQDKIVDEGREITNIYLDSEISVKKAYISTDDEIITDVNTLSKYFLFGLNSEDKIYNVKESDTLDDIAYKNKLGIEDILIANPNLGNANALLAIGQEINVSPINPLSNIVVESFDTEFQTITYDTKIEYDKTLNADQSYVKQQGSNGLSKVTYATKEMNGVILATSLVSEDVISKAVDKIVVYGSKNVVYYGNSTFWAWPTNKPFRISDGYGYRVHPIRHEVHFHAGLDITGVSNRNIYAIQSGIVTNAVGNGGYNGGQGNYIYIDHQNGYTSQYLHLSSLRVKVGDTVEKGQVIGIMGCTGSCTGTHLDFRVKKNGSNINPFNLYK